MFQGKGCFNRNQIAHQTGNLGTFHGFGSRGQRLAPCCGLQLAGDTHIRLVQTLRPQAIPDKTGFVGNPFLVHAIMVARQDAFDFAPLGIDPNVGAKRVHHVNRFGLGQLPRTGGEGIGFIGQRANRAKINDVALQVAVQGFVQIGGDFRVFATADLAHYSDARDFCSEAHATGAGNTAGHFGGNQRAKVQIINCAFGFFVARAGQAIGHRLILQIALAALIANRAIQRVVDQHEFHHAFAGLFHHRRIGFHNRRLPFGTGAQIAHLHGTGGRRFGRPPDNFDQTHAAVPRDGQAFVITKTRDFHACLFTCLNKGHCPVNFDFIVVDDDFAQVGHGVILPSTSGQ